MSAIRTHMTIPMTIPTAVPATELPLSGEVSAASPSKDEGEVNISLFLYLVLKQVLHFNQVYDALTVGWPCHGVML